MKPMAGSAVHRTPGARISNVLTHGMANLVLVPVALIAKVDRVVDKQQRPFAAVGSMAGRAVELSSVSEKATALT